MGKNKFTMMIGLPASGKSVIAEQVGGVIHSSDKLREELFGDINNQDNNNQLFKELHKRIIQNLKEGKDVIYDATNINYKKRRAFLEQINKIDCVRECILVAIPYEQCLKQNNSRERQIPKYIIDKMYKSIYIPQYYEGWNEIKIAFNYNLIDFPFDELKNKTNISQDNPNHTLTIYDHCVKCKDNVEIQTNNLNLKIAALYHDIGKVFTKQFKNAKGEETEIAHYYNHHFVSAYDSLFYLNKYKFLINDILEITNLIQWHMYPFFIKADKTKNKFINLVGGEFYNKLMILHEADILAK